MSERFGGWPLSGDVELSDGNAEMERVPVGDCRGKEVGARGAVGLILTGPVAQFAPAVEEQRPLEGMMGFAFVQSDLGSALEFLIGQPIEDEEGALDAADFAERQGEAVLAGIGRELSQDLRWDDGAGGHGGGQSKDIRPMGPDEHGVNAARDQRREGRIFRAPRKIAPPAESCESGA